jgi:hypothetical protein
MASISRRNKNPGNIKWMKDGFTTKSARGGTKGEGPFAKFPTVIKGIACLADLLATITYSTLTILELFERYAPAEDKNYPLNYARFVSDYSGIPIGAELRNITDPFKLLKFMEAIFKMEKWEE